MAKALRSPTKRRRRRPGRPPSENPKVSVTIRLDADVVDYFRGLGPGWQTRVNELLKQFAKRG